MLFSLRTSRTCKTCQFIILHFKNWNKMMMTKNLNSDYKQKKGIKHWQMMSSRKKNEAVNYFNALQYDIHLMKNNTVFLCSKLEHKKFNIWIMAFQKYDNSLSIFVEIIELSKQFNLLYSIWAVYSFMIVWIGEKFANIYHNT